jgi:hypothetical protein
MHTDVKQRVEPAAPTVAAAVFLKCKCASDAIADLAHAGFGKRQIQVAFSTGTLGTSRPEETHPDLGADSSKEHTLTWKLRQNFEHDLHRSGAQQITREPDCFSSSKNDPLYTAVSLHDTLREMGVAEDRISLLNWEIGTDGALVMVDAGERWKEATAILERNSGTIRSDTATEHPHSVA